MTDQDHQDNTIFEELKMQERAPNFLRLKWCNNHKVDIKVQDMRLVGYNQI